jgi:hypothetical protein
MISQNKKIILFASAVNVSSAVAVTAGPNSLQDIALASNQYDTVDFVINMKAIGGGTTPSLVFSFQELFNDNNGADIYIETARATGVSATGTILVTNRTTNRSQDFGGNPMLGEGGLKCIVITPTGTPSGTNIDIYAVFTN